MISRSVIRRIVFAVIVVLSLISLGLVANAPENILNAHLVYKGF